jgi:hypothetical protein
METVKDRLRVIAARFALALGEIAAFVLGSLGPFLALDWDPVRREMVLGFLIVFVVIWAAVGAGDLLFAPNDERSGSFRPIRWLRGSGAGDSPRSRAGLRSYG